MITREDFIKIIDMIKSQEQLDMDFSDSLKLILSGNFSYGTDNGYLHALLFLLQRIFDDRDDNIGWWLYEYCGEGEYNSSERPCVDSAGELYDFLTERMK